MYPVIKEKKDIKENNSIVFTAKLLNLITELLFFFTQFITWKAAANKHNQRERFPKLDNMIIDL